MEVPESREMTRDTIFDLASVTKVVVTVPLALRLVEQGLWQLDDPLARFLPEFNGHAITINHLLTHTAGIPPWANLFYYGQDRERAKRLLYTDRWPLTRPLLPPGQRVIYSDLGFILLGEAIAKLTGKPLDRLAQEWIFTPLGMKDTMFNPPISLKSRIAPTENDSQQGGVLAGTVHDETAWAMAGVSGHAGLFSTAVDLAVYAQMLLNGGFYRNARILSYRSIESMISLHTEGLNERRGFGWILQGKITTSVGDLLSERAFGHTGFTGTSLWIDPHYELIVILLTNRVHPTRERGATEIQRIRRLVNDLSVEAICDG
jgi:CubicO group peptidase (beta-lactamase class C family)